VVHERRKVDAKTRKNANTGGEAALKAVYEIGRFRLAFGIENPFLRTGSEEDQEAPLAYSTI
jgi:hypothetical protein